VIVLSIASKNTLQMALTQDNYALRQSPQAVDFRKMRSDELLNELLRQRFADRESCHLHACVSLLKVRLQPLDDRSV